MQLPRTEQDLDLPAAQQTSTVSEDRCAACTAVSRRPRLMAAAEIAARLARSRQRVQQLTEREDFPEPYQELGMGRVWLAADVEAWIRIHWRTG
ncbi:hypothetical protein [Actinoplanes regularis]|uniref:hypothetical protein n=1 Tax=Actinoplanes regularis TaxID=52697 RepID=UPI0024A082F3|nr:hypothetical protein Areg01_23910 [Actinoplanes regularis]